MKKTLLSFIVALLSSGATMAQEVVQAPAAEAPVQEQSKFRVGAGLVFGTKAGIADDGSESGGMGINVGGEYFFTERIAAAPSFTYFLKSSNENMSVRVSSLNLDGRYYFGNEGNISFYGLAGVSVAFAKVSYDYGDYGKGSVSDNETGLNVGGGLVYPLTEKYSLNAQVKYNTPLKQIALQAGVTFPLNL